MKVCLGGFAMETSGKESDMLSGTRNRAELEMGTTN